MSEKLTICKRMFGYAIGIAAATTMFSVVGWGEINENIGFGISIYGILIAIEFLRNMPKTYPYPIRATASSLVLFPFYLIANYFTQASLEVVLSLVFATGLGAFFAMLNIRQPTKAA